MDRGLAARLVDLLLANLEREYPNKPCHVIGSADDLREPLTLSPLFGGCFDWHSAVHSHFALARLLRARPEARWADQARRSLAARLTPAAIEAELLFLSAPARASFEVPYGMAWLLALCGELSHHRDLRVHVKPLETLAETRFFAWLSRLPGPIRSGEHSQSAFAMGLARDWAQWTGARARVDAIDRAAATFYERDECAPLAYEPSAYDFLSPALGEADLMARVLPAERFGPWFERFLPRVTLVPVETVDRADGKLAHAGGLNLSRAWMLRRIAAALPRDSPRIRELTACEHTHAAHAWTAPTDARYAETHWLPTFKVYYEIL